MGTCIALLRSIGNLLMRFKLENNKCVYLHKDLNGNIFYVGSGTIQRAYTKELSVKRGRGTFRGKKYSEYVKSIDFNYNVEIVRDRLSKEQAICLETELINDLRGSCFLTNVSLPAKEKVLDYELLSKYFYINPESKTGLSWRINRGQCTAGSDAGCRSGGNEREQYYRVSLFGVQYSAHRVIMVLNNVDVSGLVVDHVDGNGLNNTLSNLRIVSISENCNNRKTSNEIPCVYFIECRQHWIVHWYENGRRNTKTFSIKNFQTKEEALKAAISFKESLK